MPQPTRFPPGCGASIEPVFPIDPLAEPLVAAKRTPQLTARDREDMDVLPPAHEDATITPRKAGVAELLRAFSEGRLTPVAVLDDILAAAGDRLQTEGAALLRFDPVAAEAARISAQRWREGNARPLEGIPFVVKDIIDVAHLPVTCGSYLTGDRVASADAPVVAALRKAGAIPFAMSATTEYAAGSPFNPRFGTVVNPWNGERWTGGSSTGSAAALAARLTPLALGTDTGGSIRVPSAWCGTTGLKPTRERVSRRGVACLSFTLDHVGPMARSAVDIARVFPLMTAQPDATLSQECARAISTADLSGLTVGVAGGWFSEFVDEAVLSNWHALLRLAESAGARLVHLPNLPIADWHAAGWTILMSEMAGQHRRHLDRRDAYDPGFLARLETGLGFSAADYVEALAARRTAIEAFHRLFNTIDVLVTPGIGGEAGQLATLTVGIDGTDYPFQQIISRNTMIFDLTGLPALMLPSGFGRDGLPTASQIIAGPDREATCLTLAIALQRRSAWHRAIPPAAGI